MLKRFGGLKSNSKLAPLLIPALPCESKLHPSCNGWFIPSMEHQKKCLHCLDHKQENCFPPKITRDFIIQDITVTWQDDENWQVVHKILLLNQEEHEKYKKWLYQQQEV